MAKVVVDVVTEFDMEIPDKYFVTHEDRRVSMTAEGKRKYAYAANSPCLEKFRPLDLGEKMLYVSEISVQTYKDETADTIGYQTVFMD